MLGIFCNNLHKDKEYGDCLLGSAEHCMEIRRSPETKETRISSNMLELSGICSVNE